MHKEVRAHLALEHMCLVAVNLVHLPGLYVNPPALRTETNWEFLERSAVQPHESQPFFVFIPCTLSLLYPQFAAVFRCSILSVQTT
jgi:hypothetical protein